MGRSGRARTLLRWLAWLAGVAVLIAVLRQVGWQALADAFRRVGLRLLWMAGAYAAGNVAMGLAWPRLMPPDRRPGAGAAIASRFAAAGLNAILPFLALGEASRLLWLRREQWPEGIAAMVVDRLMLLVASALSLGVGAAALLFVPGAPQAFAVAAAVFAGMLTTLALAVVAVALKGSPVAWLGRGFDRIRRSLMRLPAAPDGPEVSAERVDEALKAVLRGPRTSLLAALALHLGGRFFTTLEVFIACRLLGVEVTVPQVLVLAAVPLALSAVAAMIPSQIGVQEGAQAVVAAALGIGSMTGVLMVLLQRGRQILFIPVTALLLAARPHRSSPTSTRHVVPHLPS